MTQKTPPYLSIILPAHNEEQRLPETLQLVTQFIQSQNFVIELVIVENASKDRTLEIAREYASQHDNVLVLHEERPGKGLAVKQGMIAASGEYRIFCDVDFSMPITEIPKFLPPFQSNVDIAIASREAKGAVRYDEPLTRHIIGRIFNMVVWILVLPGINDTQCGFKCFSAEVSNKLFPLQSISGWTFDVEILAIARQMGYKVVEVPVPWYYQPQSKVNVVKDFMRTLKELIKVRKIIRTRSYEKQI
ncbi:MAG: glycosyl transferase [Chloroflexi bacterium HGW-Chloroflexi-4]|jgi:glycosyltransferase involved in cell wall biosynthesis|nr:MAG: glycosyl transferase [Chloroflexi bacterium HGW-Chloroflexi-7]PKN97657.1 MAG: glycosyl transferase [Chloroflexi bacterium HGW-Chloroflexi-4]